MQDLILLYPLYALFFSDSGLSTAQISSLFIIWSVSSILIEVPSGVLADVISRRLLLVIAPVLIAAGFGLWVTLPSYPSFAVGFLLWGAGSALQSGALEALVYEELDRHGEAARYGRIIGRSAAARTVAIALAMLLAGPVFGAGGYSAVGAASVLACLASAAVALSFPEHRDAASVRAAAGLAGYTTTFRSGVHELRSKRRVWSAALFLIAIAAVWGSLEEYVGLLGAERGIETAEVPMFILVVYVGVAIGGLLGGVARRLSRGAQGVALALAAVALAVGALTGEVAGFVMIGLAFCIFQMIEIVADARLQGWAAVYVLIALVLTSRRRRVLRWPGSRRSVAQGS